MIPKRRSATAIFADHWFWLIFAAALLAEFWMSPVLLLENAQLAEMVILFDLCVFLPIVYAICYRKRQSVKQIALRLLGLASLGIFVATWIVPEALQTILPNLFVGRNFVMVFVAVVEFIAIIAMLKMVFAQDTDPAKIAKQSGAPEFVVKLMVLEANFWKTVWNFFNPRK